MLLARRAFPAGYCGWTHRRSPLTVCERSLAVVVVTAEQREEHRGVGRL